MWHQKTWFSRNGSALRTVKCHKIPGYKPWAHTTAVEWGGVGVGVGLISRGRGAYNWKFMVLSIHMICFLTQPPAPTSDHPCQRVAQKSSVGQTFRGKREMAYSKIIMQVLLIPLYEIKCS